MGHPQPLFNLFVSFQTIITTNNSAKCPSSILYWDLNPQPLEHESPPITTRPDHLFEVQTDDRTNGRLVFNFIHFPVEQNLF